MNRLAFSSLSRPMPEPISDAELDAILTRNRANGSVSMLRPMEVFLDRDHLIEMTRMSLDTLRAERQPDHEDPKQKRNADRAIQQRIDFAAWLGGQPQRVHIGLYPVIEDGLSDDDVQDVLDDEDLWPFGAP